MNFSSKLAESLNVMYKDVVNKKILAQADTNEYAEAESFVRTYYPKLNNMVMEFLAAFMCVHQDGKICFYPSQKEAVDLVCNYDDIMRILVFNDFGSIVRDTKGVQKEA